MADYLLELEVKFNADRVMERFEKRSLAAARKIERDLEKALQSVNRNTVQIKVESRQLQSAASHAATLGKTIQAVNSDLRSMNAELAKAERLMSSLGIKKLSPTGGGGGAANAGSSAAAQAQKQSEAVFRTNAALTKQRVAEAQAAERAIAAAAKQSAAQQQAAARQLRQQQQTDAKARQTEAALVGKLNQDMLAAKGRGANQSGDREMQRSIALQREMLRHSQLLAKIKASPIAPEAARNAQQLAGAINKINVANITKQFDDLKNKGRSTFLDLSSVVSGFTAGLTSFGLGAITSGIGAGISAVTNTLGDAKDKALDFNATLNMLRINTQASAEDMTKVRDTVLKVSAAFGIAPTEAANLALELGRMGIAAQDLPSFLQAVGSAARASGEDFNVVKDIIAQTRSVYNDMSVSDIGDVLTVGANISPAGFQAIGQGLSFVAGAAKDAGVPLDTLTKQLVILQKAGFRDDRAGTSLNALYKDVKEQAGVFEELGVAVFDANGKIRDIDAIIAETGKKLEGLTDAQKAAVLEPLDTNGTRALTALTQSYRTAAAEVKGYADALKAANGVSASQSEEALKDPKAQLQILSSQVGQLKIKLGEAFTPAIAGVGAFGNELASALLENDSLFNELNQSSEEFAQYLRDNPQFVTMLAEALGEVSRQLGGAILDQTKELLNYLEQNPKAISGMISGMAEFAGNLATVVKSASDLVSFLTQANKLVSPLQSDRGQESLRLLRQSQGGGKNSGGGSGGRQARSGFGSGVMALAGETMGAGDVSISALREAIMGQESGGNPRAVNPDSGALGLYQVMPENLPSWSQQTVGRSVSSDEFLNDPKLQTQIVEGMMQEMLRAAVASSGGNLREAVRKVAAEWYSGQQDLFDDTRPQTYGGGQYPSISEYTSSIASRYDQIIGGGAAPTQTATASQPSSPSAPQTSRIAPGNTTPFQGIQVTSAIDASGEPGLDYVVSDGQRGAPFGALAEGRVIEAVSDQNWETNLESNPGGQRGYGNQVIVRTVDALTGEFVDMLYAHLDDVAVQVGDEVGVGTILGTQGRTGSTTGAHVSVDFFGKDSNAGTNASLGMRDRFAATLQRSPSTLNSQIIENNDGRIMTAAETDEQKKQRAAQAARDRQEQERQRLVQQARANEDQATELQRQTQDRQRQEESQRRRLAIETSNQSLQGTPFEAVGQRSLAAFDLRDKYQGEVDQLRREREDLQRELSRLDERKGEPGIDKVAESYRAAIAQTEAYIKSREEAYQQELKNFEATNAAANAQSELQQRAEQAASRAARATRTMGLEISRFIGEIKDPLLQEFFTQGFQIQSLGNSYAEQIRLATEEADKLEKAIAALESSGLGMDSPELRLAQEKLAEIRDNINALKGDEVIEIEIATRLQAESLREIKSTLAQQISDAQANVLDQRGDTFGANDVRRRQAQFAQAGTYTTQLQDLEKMRGQIPDSEFEGMRTAIEELNNLSLEGINNQFLTLEQTVGKLGVEAFRGFASELFKTGDFVGSLINSLDNLASSLFDLLLNQALQSLLGGVMGGSGSGANGAMAGILDQAFSILADGNLDQMIPNYARGNAIEKAMSRERAQSGANPRLVVVNDQELILSAKQTKAFFDNDLQNVINMAGGNMPAVGSAIAGLAPSINVPLTIVAGEGQSDNSDFKAFAQSVQRDMKALADSRLVQAQRPGGSLSRRNR